MSEVALNIVKVLSVSLSWEKIDISAKMSDVSLNYNPWWGQPTFVNKETPEQNQVSNSFILAVPLFQLPFTKPYHLVFAHIDVNGNRNNTWCNLTNRWHIMWSPSLYTYKYILFIGNELLISSRYCHKISIYLLNGHI